VLISWANGESWLLSDCCDPVPVVFELVVDVKPIPLRPALRIDWTLLERLLNRIELL
jgi:hypothetical protein